MASKELKITLDLDNSRAQAQARAFRADQQKLQADMTADATRAETAKVAAARDAQGRFISASKASTDAIKGDYKAQSDEASRAYGRSKGAGVDSFTAVTVASSLARAGVNTLIDLVGGLASAYTKAGEKSKEISANFAGQRESLGNLAYLKGTKADNAFVLEQARFAASVGMTQAESTALQTAFMNSGAQFVGEGKSLSKDQADLFQQHMAKLSLARNLDPGVVADMGGQLLGMKDYSKFGKQAPDVALGDLSQALSVLSAGKGDEGKLAVEVGKLAGFALNEDELKGVFTDPTQVAKIISATAEFKPEGQAEAAASALRALRGFGRTKGGATLRAAGVTPEDDPFTAIAKVGKYAEVEAPKGPPGTKPSDILTAGFDDALGAEMIGGLYTKGVGKGVFAARDATAAANAGPAAALDANAAFLAGERGQARLAQADIDLAKIERGLENSDLTTLRKQATARLIRDKRIDTNATNFNDYLNQRATFGLLGDAEQKRIDDEAQRMLMERSPAGTKAAPFSDIFNVSPTAREEDLNARMGRIREAGGDPLDKEGGAGKIVAAIDGLGKKLTDKPRQAPPPRQIMPAPSVMRR